MSTLLWDISRFEIWGVRVGNRGGEGGDASIKSDAEDQKDKSCQRVGSLGSQWKSQDHN